MPDFIKNASPILNQIIARFPKPKYTILLLQLCALAYFVLAVIGGIKNFSPVPHWDGWAALEFFTEISNGWNFDSLWHQHNEHRIALSRMLFWIDIAIFHGTSVFLIIFNYIFALTAFVIFFFCAKESLKNEQPETLNLISAAILILLFLWIQIENFTWAFQSQFFLAQLMPLLSFYLLHKSNTSSKHHLTLFALACLSGVASSGTMANGVLALPLMIVLAIALRMKIHKIIIIAILSSITATAYFYNYHTPEIHGSVIKALIEDPIGLTKYSISYLGNPLSVISRKVLTKIAGAFLVLSSLFFAFRNIKNPTKSSSLQLSLIAFIFYIEVTAIVTGGGRLIFGVEQSLTGRYATPSVMAWSALLVLYAPAIAKLLEGKFQKLIPLIFLALPYIFWQSQLEAMKSQKNRIFAEKIGALAIELGIKDQKSIIAVHPSAEYMVTSNKLPVQRNLAIFGDPLFKDVYKIIGTKELNHPTKSCLGNVEEISEIENDGNYLRIKGWLFDDQESASPQAIHILNSSGEVIGYALSGEIRKDIKNELGKKSATNSGFRGFFLKKTLGKKVILQGSSSDCTLEIALPL